jgi:antitoxin MazE
MRWGNSLGVRIPRVYAESVGLSPGTPVEIVATDEEIVIRRSELTLETLLARVTPENLHGNVDWGQPAGRPESPIVV